MPEVTTGAPSATSVKETSVKPVTAKPTRLKRKAPVPPPVHQGRCPPYDEVEWEIRLPRSPTPPAK